MATFKEWLNARSGIKSNYEKLTPEQQRRYRSAWKAGGASAAKAVMQKFKTPSEDSSDSKVTFSEWLAKHPLIKNMYTRLNEVDRKTYEDTWNQKGTASARKFLHRALGIVDPDTSTTEIADGVHVPTPTRYPTPSLIFTDEDGNLQIPKLEEADYDYVGGIDPSQAETVGGISVPSYDTTKSIGGASLRRVGKVGQPDYQGASGISQVGADPSSYNITDPMAFASKYGEFYRGEALKNLSVADQIALTQLDTELGGLIDYAQGAAALKRREASIDNLFNQEQRRRQVEQAVPGVIQDLEGQRDRATAYAEGRLPDEMEDRIMELNTRSRAADTSAAAGFGEESAAARKTGDLMSVEQRTGLSQYGDQLLSQNIQARTDLMLAPTQYLSAGQQINVMPSQSASALSAMALGQLNENANISATTALGTTVNQEQFSANLANDISKFNASIQQDTEKFNASLSEQQAQFRANMQTQIDEFNAQMEASENLSEAEIQQRTEEFNANLETQQSQFTANLQKAVDTFNAQLAVNQNQFNATVSQRTNEFNANLATTQNQFITTLGQRVSEFNTTLEYNTETANKGIENAFSLGSFDYNVTYKGMIAGALNKKEDQLFQLKMAEMELGYYQEALELQLDFEREKLEAIRDEIDGAEGNEDTDNVNTDNPTGETKDEQEGEGTGDSVYDAKPDPSNSEQLIDESGNTFTKDPDNPSQYIDQDGNVYVFDHDDRFEGNLVPRDKYYAK